MVKRVFGRVDGCEVELNRSEGDWWNVPVPFDTDGEYVVRSWQKMRLVIRHI
jgi:hypothetical protein